jgi:biopolymer transport protein ExbD
MKLTPLQKRAVRKSRNAAGLDMNLVSLIDVFTILIFFLLSNSGEVDKLPNNGSIKLPESVADAQPKDTLVVLVSGEDIVVGSKLVAKVADVMGSKDDLIAPLKAELQSVQARQQVVLEKNAALAKTVTIMGDKNIPYQLLRKVMVTCVKSNFTDVSFVVRQKGAS